MTAGASQKSKSRSHPRVLFLTLRISVRRLETMEASKSIPQFAAHTQLGEETSVVHRIWQYTDEQCRCGCQYC